MCYQKVLDLNDNHALAESKSIQVQEKELQCKSIEQVVK